MNKILIKLLQALLPTLVEHLATWLEELAAPDCPPPPVRLGRPPKPKPAPPIVTVEPLTK